MYSYVLGALRKSALANGFDDGMRACNSYEEVKQHKFYIHALHVQIKKSH